MDWHAVINRAVDRNPVPATLVRIGSPDVEVTLNVAPIQYRDTAAETGGDVTQRINRWMVPAQRLAATVFPLPPSEGDLLIVPSLSMQARVEVVEPGFAGGDVVRWDLTIQGAAR